MLVALSRQASQPGAVAMPAAPLAFRLGLVTGLVYFSGTLYWITHVMIVYAGFENSVGSRVAVPLAASVNAALVAYLALFPALFALAVRRLVLRFGPLGLMAAPIVWVATELGRARLFTGFPWVLLGYSQAAMLPVAQLASVFGVYGVSALVASVSAAAAICVVCPDGRARGRAVLAVGALLVGSVVWGSARTSRAAWTRAGVPLRVGLVQGNVEETDKMDSQRAASIFQDYLALTRQALARGADLVIWPESSTPFMFEEDPIDAERIRAIARQAHVPILLGSDQMERGSPPRYFNSAFLVGAGGATAGVYRKMHLVPFGEYVPLKRLLFFAGPLVQAVGPFSAGETADLLPLPGHLISTAICYEIVYPELVRLFVREGSELLTTMTNDAWFGWTSAPFQHFTQASMRAIEEGRFLVRAANTGISGIVDPYGRVLAASELFRPAVIVGEVRLLRETTLYARWGDAFAYASVLVTVAMLGLRGGRRTGFGNLQL